MPKWIKQTEAVSRIQGLLLQRGFDIPSRIIALDDNQRWMILEHRGRQIGVDATSGVWVRASTRESWRCLAMPCTVSGAIQAVEFLTHE